MTHVVIYINQEEYWPKDRSFGHPRDHLLFIRNCASIVGLLKPCA